MCDQCLSATFMSSIPWGEGWDGPIWTWSWDICSLRIKVDWQKGWISYCGVEVLSYLVLVSDEGDTQIVNNTIRRTDDAIANLSHNNTNVRKHQDATKLEMEIPQKCTVWHPGISRLASVEDNLKKNVTAQFDIPQTIPLLYTIQKPLGTIHGPSQQKEVIIQILRLDQQGREIDEHGNLVEMTKNK